MSLSGSVSIWIESVKTGCDTAATKLWGRYRHRLLGLARTKIVREARAVADEEDVAVTAFQSFLRRCRQGSYPDLRDRDDLWRLLMTITLHKAENQVRAQVCTKRKNTTVHTSAAETRVLMDWDKFASPDFSPELAVSVSDSLRHLLEILPDAELRQIVLYKLEGYTNEELVTVIGRSLPTIERRLRLIRESWREELES